jgi:2-methylcitrate dehydratase
MDKTTEALARYAASVRYSDLSAATVAAAKRHIIDTLGCAMGGHGSEPADIARRLARSNSGTPGARLLGDGTRTSVQMAAFANSVMIRYLDANDTYIARGSGHPSDVFGALLAAADAQGASGKALITATVAAYEVFGALADAVGLRDRGWDQGVFIAPAAAAGGGLLFGLTLEQTGQALAIAVTANVPTRQTRAGELSMWKGSATAAAGVGGLFAAELAREGMTGPTAAFEGRHGLWEQATGPFELGTLGGHSSSAIERANLKYYATEYHSQAPISAALVLREKLKGEEIETVDVQTYWTAYSEIGSEAEKWDPRSRETADHSLPYLLAVALRDGRITPAIFEPKCFLDPALRPLMKRIRIAENPEFTKAFPDALISEITVKTRSGRSHVERTAYPKGHARNPMNDEDIERKFRDLAGAALAPAQADAALAFLRDLENAPDVRKLLDVFTIAGRAS